MKFLWPEMLWMLLALPLLVAAYVAILRRRRRLALRFASLSVVREALGGSGWRRHLPPALLLAALALLLVALARPTALVRMPSKQEIVILAMDTSGSMRAKDVEPNRLVAAQNAAKAFLADLPASTRVGVVAFAATASVVQSPTHSREDIVAAIDRFQLQRGTATGSAILVALATLFPDAGIDVSSAIYGGAFEHGQRGRALDDKAKDKPAAPEFTPVAPGSYTSAAIIMLSDGQRTTGPDPLKAARLAADRGVRIYTVGVGTPKGEVIGFEGWSFRAQLDEETLKSIAHMTLGEYFYAGDAEALTKIYRTLTSRLVLERKESEITVFLAAAAALLIVAAAGLSTLWVGRIA